MSEPEIKLQSEGTYFGNPVTLACDQQCNKAWGINNRPRVMLSMDEDDHAYLADSELDDAPVNPGTYEGDESKPNGAIWRHNKWCARECERCRMVDRGEPIVLRDFSKRRFNIRTSAEVQGRLDFTVYWTKSSESGEFYVSAVSLEEATKIAQWQADLYKDTFGAEIKLIEGIIAPIHGGVTDYAE